ncbi:MAG: HEAT repeat domain-containing protein [Cyanobacteria bacterium]|nr:HEAT repeat domain-containing protein [Cyanobacteria bacterium CG_2015-16_32_12]NCO79160.1 HEAT repeat domain-containing protein [Cyanobacteria bacterium CG_2015-22_32_23]NCQ04877.1 HEAT repeat domain-containing protein [Cyanobacteria bacterium CG_2015-09_32_10]NCQ41240.1 HEAT repeat domain-containing protein [Cyanobacteria bacterium CG_2015-04_32_10]NCS84989.1 HEAT repeat domain-containing protein [Cyanobacteria bacterium CG_2015-02_32_10]
MNTSTIITRVNQLINAVEKADSAPKLYEAVVELANSKSVEAIPTLIQVLGYNNPGAAVAATEGLIALGESVIEPLLRSLDNYNYGARAWAVRVFAGIGDIRALDLLTLSALNDFSLSVRRAATKGLGNLQWHQLSSENIIIIQTQVLETLLVTANDGEWVVRYASIVSLEDLYQSIDSTYQDLLLKIIHTLKEIITIDAEIAIQSRAKLALKKIDNK